ncbi:MAG: diversity-generating retroelement protein bAvd family protein [Acidobacteria bacterium]|nr:MAG: diversity-generating retroelement protein bAvd family protein [Acidobacteriota bacterium]PYQ89926.1 MAG: diversity-generating retroelement protein bAvd family protein [Acidobacteriota bacterium]PYR08831.1 MAG: diversity-generating retroelement protein bAvd family protein [Acidobacteriota bacterium]
MQDFRNLNVWQLARRLTKTIYQLTINFPESEEFGLKAQMRRATVSICSNIAEGCGRRGDREFRRFLDVAMGSACELECETILSFDLAFITEIVHDTILASVVEIKRMLGGLIGSLTCGPAGRRRVRIQDKETPLDRERRADAREPKAGRSTADS